MQVRIPFALLLLAICASAVDAWLMGETARKFGHDIPLTACFEFTSFYSGLRILPQITW